MDALILSCGTGGGHNAAGKAIKEELEKRGHHVTMMDPYSLVSDDLSFGIGNVYIRLVQKMPKVFGFVYMLGELYRRLPFRSPVYFINKKPAKALSQYLKENPADVIVMPHLYPAEITTYMKNLGLNTPKTVFVATDYTCIPFTEETDCDYYVIPHKDSVDEFCKRGIPKEKLLPFGIPVGISFTEAEKMSKGEAKKVLGLDEKFRYYLLAGGSVGAGGLVKLADRLYKSISRDPKAHLIIICGSNEKIYQKLKEEYGIKATVIKNTDKMALYLRAGDLYLTKPGGLSSTESAVVGVPLIMTGGIPGCETKNRKFFWKRGMCFRLRSSFQLNIQLSHLKNEKAVNRMIHAQHTHIDGKARENICDFLEGLVSEDKEYYI